MMKHEEKSGGMDCEIVRDLLPLYCDGVVSETTAGVVKAHLEDCAACRAEYEMMERPLPIEETERSTGDSFRQLLQRQRRTTWLKLVYLLSVLSLCLPWFTFNAKIMGYRFGFVFWAWFVQYIVVVGAVLFTQGMYTGKLALWAAEVSAFLNLGALVDVAGRWMEVCNIKGGFHLREGISAAQPGYWVSAVLFVLFFLLFQYHLWKTLRERRRQTSE